MSGARVEIIEYTDPGCSWAWGTEPVRRLVRRQIGDRVAWRRVMGGLVGRMEAYLPDFDPAAAAPGFATYWQGVSRRTRMPFPATLRWMYRSTEPACLTVKAAERHGEEMAERVLRRLREATFVLGEPPDTPERIGAVVAGIPGLDVASLLADLDDPTVRAAFHADWEETRRPDETVMQLEEEGEGAGRAKFTEGHWRYAFPTFTVRGPGGRRIVPGWKPLERFLEALEAAAPGVTADPPPDPSPAEALTRWGSLTERELAALCGPDAAPPPDAVAVDLGGGVLWLSPEEAAARRLPATREAATGAGPPGPGNTAGPEPGRPRR